MIQNLYNDKKINHESSKANHTYVIHGQTLDI